MSDVEVGRDLSAVDQAVEELASVFQRRPGKAPVPVGSCIRVQIRGMRYTDGAPGVPGKEIGPVNPVMPIAVMKLLQKYPSKLRAVKWQAQNGADVMAGAEAAEYVSILRTPDLHGNFGKEYVDQLGENNQIVSAENSGDLDDSLEPEPLPDAPSIVITGE